MSSAPTAAVQRYRAAQATLEARATPVWRPWPPGSPRDAAPARGVGTPKSHQRRLVPLAGFIAEQLAEHVRGKSPDDLVFTARGGGPLRNSNFRRDTFNRAATSVGLSGLRIHDLRHTAASLAVGAGANVKAVQQMLGHASAAMTLDVYAGLLTDDLSDVAQRLHEAATARDVVPVWSPPHGTHPQHNQNGGPHGA